MEADSAKKTKIIVLVVVGVLAAGVWAYSLMGDGKAAAPAPSAKVDALKAGYDKVEKPSADDAAATPPQPSKGPRQSK